jgi:hypothetical protein
MTIKHTLDINERYLLPCSIEDLNNTTIYNIPPGSFITALDGPFQDRHKHLCYIVKTALVNNSINLNIDALKRDFHKMSLSGQIKIRIIYSSAFLKNNDISLTNNENLHPFIFIKQSVENFVRDASKDTFSNKVGVREFYIFAGFSNWSSIKKDIYNISKGKIGKGIDVNGGDSSRRHALNSLAIRLQTFLLIVYELSETKLLNNISFDKHLLASKFDAVSNVESN